jgi:cytochrome c biogenesis protein CcmG, thiol:disulfide interchange protein DsbE
LKQTARRNPSNVSRSATVWDVRRGLLWILGVVILTAMLVIGLTQAGSKQGAESSATSSEPFDLDTAREELQGSPAPLASLHDQSAQLLQGGVPAFESRLAALRGHPVVVNKWASWCNPCRAEFPAFQRVATERGQEIAFLGVNSGDSTQPARRFLGQFPVPFPSYVDPDEAIARKIGAPANYPVTVFIDARGKTAFIHQGGYVTKEELEADLDRYIGV